MKLRLSLGVAAGILTAVAACKTTQSPTTDVKETTEEMKETMKSLLQYDGDSLVRPEGYRNWVFVGEPVTPNDLNGGKAPFPEFHSVYIDPESYDHYQKTGNFRDGTVLIKELTSVGSKEAVSGKGYFMGEFIGLEATVKDSKRFPNEPGNWAYFSFTNPQGGALADSAKAFPTESCNACHAGNAQDDFVFTQYYPVLRAAKNNIQPKTGPEPFVMDGNKLIKPVGYREWTFVGEPLTPNDMNNGKAPFPEFHSVYIDNESYDYWTKNGEFRDGTILVKELVSVGSKEAVSGKGYFMGEFIGLEATIKSKKHFPNEPGNWAYFSFTNPEGGEVKPTAEAFPTNSCNSCHAANAKDDFVFTQYYPVLRAAANMSSSSSSSSNSNSTWQPTAPSPSEVGGVPLDAEGLLKYLQGKEYLSYPAKEANAHPGRGPHTSAGKPVKVFYNKTLADSFAAKSQNHPVGSISVKEMFTDGGDLTGWAVMAKTSDEANGKGWYWYEITSTTDAGSVVASGNGIPGCISCHSLGSTDYVVSGYPLK